MTVGDATIKCIATTVGAGLIIAAIGVKAIGPDPYVSLVGAAVAGIGLTIAYKGATAWCW